MLRQALLDQDPSPGSITLPESNMPFEAQSRGNAAYVAQFVRNGQAFVYLCRSRRILTLLNQHTYDILKRVGHPPEVTHFTETSHPLLEKETSLRVVALIERNIAHEHQGVGHATFLVHSRIQCERLFCECTSLSIVASRPTGQLPKPVERCRTTLFITKFAGERQAL